MFSGQLTHIETDLLAKGLNFSITSKDNLSKDERKTLKELQSDTYFVILPADKGRSAVILNSEDYLEKCIDHINNGPYQLLKKRSYHQN